MGEGKPILNEQLRLLTQLQRIDSEIDQIEERKQEIPGEISRLEKSYQSFGQEVQRLRDRIEEINRLRQKKEHEAERERENLKKSQLKLREVKTNKEYKAMLKEIETLKERISASEEEILNYMILLEEETERLRGKEKELQERKEDFLRKKKEKEEEIARLEQLLEEKRRDKGEIICGLDERAYQGYLRLREGRNGIAVVNVVDGICQGCYMVLPPQTFNEVKKNDQIINCTHCSRILFWANP